VDDATLIDGVGATEGAMAMQLSRRGQTGAERNSCVADRLLAEDGARFAGIRRTASLPPAARCACRLHKDPKDGEDVRIVEASASRSSATGQWNATARCSCRRGSPASTRRREDLSEKWST